MTFEEATKIRHACLDHAVELLLAADVLLTKYPYLAYHLSALALEEIGKSIQIGMAALPPRKDKPPLSDFDDHVQKLFWACWSTRLSRQSLTPEHMNQCRELAKEIHNIRLKALYVDYTNNSLSIPKYTVSVDQATKLLDFAKVRLELAKVESVL